MNPLDLFTNKDAEWLRGEGEHGNVVMSTRIRLARNLKGLAFPHRLSAKGRLEVIRALEQNIQGIAELKDTAFINVSDLSPLERKYLFERHIISKEQAESVNPTAACVSKNEMSSIMIMEEDHIRIQVLKSGLDLLDSWQLASRLDDRLAALLPLAFDKTLGYLTACPTNVGTGLRASCMLHIPALVMTKQISKILQAISKIGLTARGMYGEGTDVRGNLFQLSNQATLGETEERIIDSLQVVIRQVIRHEKESRALLLKKKKLFLEDQVCRALGLLKTARVISSQEAMGLFSVARLGLDMGLIEGIGLKQLNGLFLCMQPAHLQIQSKKNLSASGRDQMRAEILRKGFKDVN